MIDREFDLNELAAQLDIMKAMNEGWNQRVPRISLSGNIEVLNIVTEGYDIPPNRGHRHNCVRWL